jgi:hypothetical protein
MRPTMFALLTLVFMRALSFAFAQAQTPTPDSRTSAPTTAAAQPVEEPKICVEQDSGGNSRLGTRKVCYTQKEWDALPRARR